MYVVKIKKAIETKDRYYIFMEYCNGGDLKDLMEAKNNELPFPVVCKIMK